MACSTTFDSHVLVWRHYTRQQNKRKASDVLSISSDSDLSVSPESPPFVFGSKVEESDTSLPGSDPSAIMDGIDCASQMALLHDDADDDPTGDIGTVPIFTEAVRKHAADMHGAKANLTKEAPFNQYGLIAGDVSADMASDSDRRIFYNVSAPSSTFICGSQGSGKSHSLSCLLENCLIHSPAGTLKKALTGIVFHYDTFVADTGGSPCEAACLASHQSLDVRVLCAPTNIVQIKNLYRHLPSVKIEELRLNQSDLNTKRMMDLMAVKLEGSDGSPLYIQIITKVLREMRMEEQHRGTGFNYSLFKRKMDNESLTKMQLGPLKQRLDVLESFMNPEHAKAYIMRSAQPKQHPHRLTKAQKKRLREGEFVPPSQGTRSQTAVTPPLPSLPVYALPQALPHEIQNTYPQVVEEVSSQPIQQAALQAVPDFARESIWTPKPGRLTIVDLSCPMVPVEMACSLFNMCLSLFLEQDSDVGRVIALDEAHKYMGRGQESQALTGSLETAIRIQRHIGARVIISTQEPTISPRLLDLCSVTIVHRFSSPEWLEVLKNHLAGASHLLSNYSVGGGEKQNEAPSEVSNVEDTKLPPPSKSSYQGVKPMSVTSSVSVADLFRRIVSLRTGEALIFAPSAAIGIDVDPGNADAASSGPEKWRVVRLGSGVLRVRVRKRVTQDGGRSIMAA